jgi:hypothetical protein
MAVGLLLEDTSTLEEQPLNITTAAKKMETNKKRMALLLLEVVV